MTLRPNVVIATPEQIDQAQRVLGAQDAGRPALVSDSRNGARPLPPELAQVLESVLLTLARGGSLTIETMPDLLTTTQAAKLLGESRPTLIKRIESGELPSTMVGSHHRLRTNDVLALRRMRLEQRRAAALELLDLEDKLGL
ncbi:DNA binding domain protein, excisionase family [Nostocoides australiense Ben110]|uniref:DNA binding domain protein, excisionase family n=1 Tax=Nostocoides australiense Ben110 TaxID=1193182 RepID=W6K2L0_9MICO|nr:helix-turn-helix domain-containing protein [Tetrasphaera australiensis]CCH75315.1 DNA binding domain protein, excisionase family [Tetrasphaera australiensis Ben110]